MAKNSLADWSATAANNTDVGGINIAEGMNAAAVNNAMREMMAQHAAEYAASGGRIVTPTGAAAGQSLSDLLSVRVPAGATRAEIQAEIDAVEAAGGGEVVLSPGAYTVDDTLVIDSPKVVLRGVGGVEPNTAGVIITATHTDAPVIWVQADGCELHNLMVSASTARRTADRTATNCGIRIEPPDTGGASLQYFRASRVTAHNQPGDGWLVQASIYSSVFDQCFANDANGHGIVIGDGTYTGRTNKSPVGVLEWRSGAAIGCKGHALLVGHPDQTGPGALRVLVKNFDCYSSGTTSGSPSAFLLDDYVIYAACDEFTFEEGAINGSNVLGCMVLAGRGIDVNMPRLLLASGTERPIKVLNAHGADNRATADVRIRIGTTTKTTGTYDYAVDATGMVPSDGLIVEDLALDGTVVGLVGPTGKEALRTQRAQVATHFGPHLFRESVYSDTVTIADDAAAAIDPPSGVFCGFLAVTVNPGSATPNSNAFAIVYYDAGSSPVIAAIGSLPTQMEVLSGDVTGTTGSDDHATIGVSGGQIKVENRLGASANVRYFFFGG